MSHEVRKGIAGALLTVGALASCASPEQAALPPTPPNTMIDVATTSGVDTMLGMCNVDMRYDITDGNKIALRGQQEPDPRSNPFLCMVGAPVVDVAEANSMRHFLESRRQPWLKFTRKANELTGEAISSASPAILDTLEALPMEEQITHSVAVTLGSVGTRNNMLSPRINNLDIMPTTCKVTDLETGTNLDLGMIGSATFDQRKAQLPIPSVSYGAIPRAKTGPTAGRMLSWPRPHL
jgi:hypothetical protein